MARVNWTEYEIRKKQIADKANSAEEYERLMKELCVELGI
jgi:hypothetical protein